MGLYCSWWGGDRAVGVYCSCLVGAGTAVWISSFLLREEGLVLVVVVVATVGLLSEKRISLIFSHNMFHASEKEKRNLHLSAVIFTDSNSCTLVRKWSWQKSRIQHAWKFLGRINSEWTCKYMLVETNSSSGRNFKQWELESKVAFYLDWNITENKEGAIYFITKSDK